eukprot:7831412-Alexandrium_andersonii.AAC.1
MCNGGRACLRMLCFRPSDPRALAPGRPRPCFRDFSAASCHPPSPVSPPNADTLPGKTALRFGPCWCVFGQDWGACMSRRLVREGLVSGGARVSGLPEVCQHRLQSSFVQTWV